MNELLSLPEVAVLIGLSIDSIRKKMTRGDFPRPTHQRGRNKYWSRRAVEKAAANLTKPINEKSA